MLETLQFSDADLMDASVQDLLINPSTPTAVYIETKNLCFEPHNLDNIRRAVRSLGDQNIVLSLQTG